LKHYPVPSSTCRRIQPTRKRKKNKKRIEQKLGPKTTKKRGRREEDPEKNESQTKNADERAKERLQRAQEEHLQRQSLEARRIHERIHERPIESMTQLDNAFGNKKRIELDYTYLYRTDKKPPKPEDAIPDTPENKAAREMVRMTATTGLRAPLGKEMKIMQCWRCGSYGHRTGDRDCPLFLSGSAIIEDFHKRHEDPMSEACFFLSLGFLTVTYIVVIVETLPSSL